MTPTYSFPNEFKEIRNYRDTHEISITVQCVSIFAMDDNSLPGGCNRYAIKDGRESKRAVEMIDIAMVKLGVNPN